MKTFKVGTRQSELALTQTKQVIEQLQHVAEKHGIACRFEIEKFITKGDRILDRTLSKVGGKGLFVKEIEQSLQDGVIDMAVHSMKDVPSELPQGLIIGAIPRRVDPRDCLITSGPSSLEELPQGASIGTSSLRRASQLKAYRADFQIVPLRGNIGTRIEKLESQSLDAIVLAVAGLQRVGWERRISVYLSPEVCIPAVGQGALAIECREQDDETRALLALLHDESSALAVAAERSFLQRLDGSCQIPIGAYAQKQADAMEQLSITGIVGAPDGSLLLKETMIGNDPALLGRQLADELIHRGADRIIAEARG